MPDLGTILECPKVSYHFGQKVLLCEFPRLLGSSTVLPVQHTKYIQSMAAIEKVASVYCYKKSVCDIKCGRAFVEFLASAV